MLQRIQTIFLFIAALAVGLLLLPVFSFLSIPISNPPLPDAMLVDGKYNVMDHPVMLVLTGLVAVLFLVSIFMFRNRHTQSQLVRIGLIGVILLVVTAAIFFTQVYQSIPNDTAVTIDFGVLNPLVASVMSWLGLRRIRQDEQVVRSMDRLR